MHDSEKDQQTRVPGVHRRIRGGCSNTGHPNIGIDILGYHIMVDPHLNGDDVLAVFA